MINAPEQHIIPVIPSPDQFSRWVEESMARLGKRPSHYLLECECASAEFLGPKGA